MPESVGAFGEGIIKGELRELVRKTVKEWWSCSLRQYWHVVGRNAYNASILPKSNSSARSTLSLGSSFNLLK